MGELEEMKAAAPSMAVNIVAQIGRAFCFLYVVNAIVTVATKPLPVNDGGKIISPQYYASGHVLVAGIIGIVVCWIIFQTEFMILCVLVMWHSSKKISGFTLAMIEAIFFKTAESIKQIRN